MRIAVIHHLERPFLGHAGPPLGAVSEHFRGTPLPDLDGVDAIVSFGGEQSVLEAGPLEPEAELLREAVARDVPVLGVCLGAQLLAHALGGSVTRRPRRFIAWLPLESLDRSDPVLGALPAELLSRPDGDGAQAFRFGSAWGIQFHPEVDPESLEHWYARWAYAVEQAGVAEADARAADARYLPGQAALSEAIFGGFARYAFAHTATALDARA